MKFDARPRWPDTAEPLAVRAGQRWIDQNEFKAWLSQQIVERFSAEVDEERARGSEALGEVGTHPITLVIESDDLWFRSRHGVDHQVRRIMLKSSVTITETMLPVTRYRFGDVGVSEARAQTGGEAAVLVVSQEPGKEPVAKLVPRSHSRS